jgi:hypothetical protein
MAARIQFVGVIFAVAALFAALAHAEDKPKKPILLELFTSEGCSSCPPADALLRDLDEHQPVDGAELVVLSEHVDYWDDLGWRDIYSLHALTERQTAYSQRLKSQGPYTPQLVVDGTYEFVGSDRSRALEVLKKARELPKINVQITSARREGDTFYARVDTGPLPKGAEVMLGLLQDRAESQVRHGENKGRDLQHVAVVRALTVIGSGPAAFSKDVKVALHSPDQAFRVVAFVQGKNEGHVLGVALVQVPK